MQVFRDRERWRQTQQREEDRRYFRQAICWALTRPSSTTTGTRPYGATFFADGRWQPPCSWESPWCWGAKRTAPSSPCATVVLIAASRLSCGWFDGSAVTCKYHGWVFEPESGQCMEIPSLTSQDSYPRRIYATAFPCQEKDGYAWVYVPKPGSGRVRMESRDTLPSVPELPKFSERHRSAHLSADLPCNVDHGIIGLMDPAHGPFVHQAWWWRSRHSIHEKEKHFEPIPAGLSHVGPHSLGQQRALQIARSLW